MRYGHERRGLHRTATALQCLPFSLALRFREFSMNIRFFLGLSLILFGFSSHLSAMELSGYQTLKETSPDLTKIYIAGVGQGYSWSTTIAEEKWRKTFYCPPSKIALNGDNYLAILDKAIEQGDYESSYPVELILYWGLVDAFPCA